jgi:hypothetical protein
MRAATSHTNLEDDGAFLAGGVGALTELRPSPATPASSFGAPPGPVRTAIAAFAFARSTFVSGPAAFGSRGGSIETQLSSDARPPATRAARAAREADRVSSGPEWISSEEIASGRLVKHRTSGPEQIASEEIASG